MRLGRLLPLLLLAGCTVGAPPGFSSGDSWSFPLVTPLENGPLLVPVTIEGKGPFLFQIDPDAPTSVMDNALVSELDLRGGVGPEFLDESDKWRNTKIAEVHHIGIGTLSINGTKSWLVTPLGVFNTGGHQVRGIIGRDIFADSLAWGFDRKTGMGWLATQKGFQKPEGAGVITTRVERSRESSGIRVLPRHLTHAMINGHQQTVHVDLGATTSRLRKKFWDDDGLTSIPMQRRDVDETGTAHEQSEGAVAKVEIGGITAESALFIPYDEKRWDTQLVDGTVALDVFVGHRVWANQNDGTYYVTDEQDPGAKGRIDRWGSTELSGCAVPACTTAEVVAAEGEQPLLTVSRTDEVAGMALEVLLEAGPNLPRLIAIFPAGERQVTLAVDSTFIGAAFQVVDVSPFPRACKAEGPCVYQLAEQQ